VANASGECVNGGRQTHPPFMVNSADGNLCIANLCDRLCPYLNSKELIFMKIFFSKFSKF